MFDQKTNSQARDDIRSGASGRLIVYLVVR